MPSKFHEIGSPPCSMEAVISLATQKRNSNGFVEVRNSDGSVGAEWMQGEFQNEDSDNGVALKFKLTCVICPALLTVFGVSN
jgi:hypothetical protein